EFVLQTVLERRLGPQAARGLSIRYAKLSQLTQEVKLLLSLVAHDQCDLADAQTAFQNAVTSIPDVGLMIGDLLPTENLDFFEVRSALDKLNQLAPLEKPFLIRAMLAAATPVSASKMTESAADLLRGVCAAIDAPIPEAVSATYAVLH
ncbi:MAG: peptidase, partial [Burkholderiales bacterium]|nr:peptidase [Burkholderiales bacterium]